MKRLVAAAVLMPGLLVLTACSTSGAGAASPPTARLTVRVSISGGPANPDGRATLNNSPVPHVRITAIDAAGHRWRGVTDAHGIATFRLTPGGYVVVPKYCGNQRHRVSVHPNQTAHVQISCDVP